MIKVNDDFSRHEMPVKNDLSNQNLKDRYFGRNDPVAKRLLDKINDQNTSVKPPNDRAITSLKIANLSDAIPEDALREALAKFGMIDALKINREEKRAKVIFAARASTEAAMDSLHGQFTINNVSLDINWDVPHMKPVEGERVFKLSNLTFSQRIRTQICLSQ